MNTGELTGELREEILYMHTYNIYYMYVCGGV